MVYQQMPSVPVDANPFACDLFHMGQHLGQNVLVFFPKHISDEQPYIIVQELTTGQRGKILLTMDKQT